MEKTLKVYMPVRGRVVPLSELTSYLFKDKMVGEGVAIIPEESLLVSPVSGTVEVVSTTNHSIIIKTAEGAEVLVHFGIDTARLAGRAIASYVREGDHVKAGDKLIFFDMEYYSMNANVSTPIVITNQEIIEGVEINYKAGKAGNLLMEYKII